MVVAYIGLTPTCHCLFCGPCFIFVLSLSLLAAWIKLELWHGKGLN